MAQAHHKTLLRKVLLGFISEDDPVLAMLEGVAHQMMLIEAESKVGAEKEKHSKERKTYFSGARVRRMDTRLETCYLMECSDDWPNDRRSIKREKIQEAMEHNRALLVAQAAS